MDTCVILSLFLFVTSRSVREQQESSAGGVCERSQSDEGQLSLRSHHQHAAGPQIRAHVRVRDGHRHD